MIKGINDKANWQQKELNCMRLSLLLRTLWPHPVSIVDRNVFFKSIDAVMKKQP